MKAIYLVLMTLGLCAITMPQFYKSKFMLMYNMTESMPYGIYYVFPAEPRKGDIVVANVTRQFPELSDQSHTIQKQSFKIIKPVVADYGDTICRYGREIFINGKYVAYALMGNRNGRQLATWQGCMTLSENELFLLSKHPRSFDSRYFGLVRKDQIIGVVLFMK